MYRCSLWTVCLVPVSCSACPIGQYQQTMASHVDIMLCVQVQFVDSVLGSGLLLYLSPTWLSELYQQTVTLSLMDVAHLSMADCPLLQMLEGLSLWQFLEPSPQPPPPPFFISVFLLFSRVCVVIGTECDLEHLCTKLKL